VPKSGISRLKPLTAGLLLPLSALAIFDDNYRKNVMPVHIISLAQLFYWQVLQSNKYNDKGKYFYNHDYDNNNWSFHLDFSTLNLDKIEVEGNESIRLGTRYQSKFIRISGLRNYTFSVGLDRKLHSDLTAGFTINYFPATNISVEFIDTLKYGMSRLVSPFVRKYPRELVFLNLDVNWRLVKFLTQKIYISFGYFWGMPLERNKTVLVRRYIIIDTEYDTVSFKYKLQPYGFSAGFLIDSPITSRFSFIFRMRLYYPITSTVFDEKKKQILPTWHTGIAYKF
jgi:hypothetical protein